MSFTPIGTTPGTAAAGDAPAAAITAHAAASDPHGDRAAATSAIATHAAASDPHGDRAAASSAIATHAGAVDPHGDRAAATSAIATHAGAADPHADRSFATSAISTHAAAVDPHGDRAAATAAIATHAAAADPHGDRAFDTAAIATHAAAADPHGDRSFATAADAAFAPRLLTNIERSGRIFRSALPNHATPFILLTGVAYFVYLGRLTVALTPKFVEFHVGTIGAGGQTAEVGLFSSPAAPSKAGQSLTKLVASATVDALTGLGVKRNTSAFATSVAAGTHLWAGIRTAMATTQPTLMALGYDMAQGLILQTAGAGVLTGAGPFSGAIIAANVAQVCPDLRVTLD